MNEETQFTIKPEKDKSIKDESGLFNISIRGWLALIVIGTVCAMSLLAVEVKEPLYTMTGMMIAFYYAQNKTQPPPTKIL